MSFLNLCSGQGWVFLGRRDELRRPRNFCDCVQFLQSGIAFSNWVLSLFLDSSSLMQIGLLCEKEDPRGCHLLWISVIAFDSYNLGFDFPFSFMLLYFGVCAVGKMTLT
ncbi:hypothetical protein V8G54_019300 [Vigna mungo]|uniref:Uncharacterized protein n=1 Tax=Vigna mungo TaxID=3915 RepID=A0AAQ3N9V5_VIGMU